MCFCWDQTDKLELLQLTFKIKDPLPPVASPHVSERPWLEAGSNFPDSERASADPRGCYSV